MIGKITSSILSSLYRQYACVLQSTPRTLVELGAGTNGERVRRHARRRSARRADLLKVQLRSQRGLLYGCEGVVPLLKLHERGNLCERGVVILGGDGQDCDGQRTKRHGRSLCARVCLLQERATTACCCSATVKHIVLRPRVLLLTLLCDLKSLLVLLVADEAIERLKLLLQPSGCAGCRHCCCRQAKREGRRAAKSRKSASQMDARLSHTLLSLRGQSARNSVFARV